MRLPRAGSRPPRALPPRGRAPLAALLAGALAGGGCADLRGIERSTVSTSQNVASAHWFRGTPLSMQPVTQGDVVVNTPLATGGTISLITWYNAQLTNNTGHAFFPDGRGGQMTEIDVVANYAQRLAGVDVSVGGIAYTYPEVRPSTKEAYAAGALEALGISHALTAYYDVDRNDDFYLQYQATRAVALDEQWNAAIALLVGWMSDGQAEFYFGKKTSGLSDLLLTGTLTYQFDANTSFYLKAAGVTVPDDELEAALDDQGVEDAGLWLTIGAAWGL